MTAHSHSIKLYTIAHFTTFINNPHLCDFARNAPTILIKMRSATAVRKNAGFDPDTFLATIGDGRKILSVPKKQVIFAQGDDADAVFYVQKGNVRLTVVSKSGKEATIAIVNEKNFFGEGSLKMGWPERRGGNSRHSVAAINSSSLGPTGR